MTIFSTVLLINAHFTAVKCVAHLQGWIINDVMRSHKIMQADRIPDYSGSSYWWIVW